MDEVQIKKYGLSIEIRKGYVNIDTAISTIQEEWGFPSYTMCIEHGQQNVSGSDTSKVSDIYVIHAGEEIDLKWIECHGAKLITHLAPLCEAITLGGIRFMTTSCHPDPMQRPRPILGKRGGDNFGGC